MKSSRVDTPAHPTTGCAPVPAARPSWFAFGLAGLFAAALLLVLPRTVWAQGAVEASGSMRVAAIEVRLVGIDASTEAARKLEADVRRAFGIFPGRRYGGVEVDLALARLRGSGLVAGADAQFQYGADDGVRIVLLVDAQPRVAPPPRWSDALVLLDEERRLLKIRLGLKGAAAVSRDQWFGNGATLTQYNPRGVYQGDEGPNGVLDLAPSVGLAGALPLADGPRAPYLYASVLYLGAGSVGQDNNRSDTRFTGQWEEAFVGVATSGVTEAGSPWSANLSYGTQPYCIGNGMLLCQIASSGGDRAADFAWPRWSGERFLKAQFRLDHTLFEAFRFTPNDFPSTNTTLAGVNVDHDNRRGLSLGVTALKALDGELKYFFPDGRSQTRDGLRVWHLRGAWWPASGGLIGKAEFAQQTHDAFDMRAHGLAVEGGWLFAGTRGAPSLTYRYSRTTGDDPTTPRYERWDLLYSGGDINTWVQGQLMKNVHYNSNVAVQRVLGRFAPDPQWRLTGALSTYRADQLNNIGGVISTLADRSLGSELLFAAEYFASRNVYWRFTAASLWPGSGVRGTLPDPVAKPWLVAIAQFNVSY